MKNKALLVGINKYPQPSNELRGCINDINDMAFYISEKNKVYSKENIKILTDSHATKSEIIKQIKWLVEGAEAGDQLLFHYSGHGAQAPTLHPTLEPDGLDEIICPFDFDGSVETTLRDKEFAQLFAALPKEAHFVWISDSCHSQDLSRDLVIDLKEVTKTRFRFFQGSATLSPIKESTIIASLDHLMSPFKGALLSGCASHQLSADAFINQRFNGAFTYYLLRNLEKYGTQKSIQELIPMINKDLQSDGYDQNPHSEGLLVHKNFFL